MFDKFTHQYPLSKTLRFALRPVGETQKHIEQKRKDGKNFLEQDEQRAQDYKDAKKIIDEYHKDFINKELSSFAFELEDLEKFREIYNELKKNKKNKKNEKNEKIQKELKKNNEKIQKELFTEQNKLRNRVYEQFKTAIEKDEYIAQNNKGEKYPIFKIKDNSIEATAEFIKYYLLEWIKQNQKIKEIIKDPEPIIKKFEKWTSYFGGFNENRKNIYTSKAHSTGIAYRLIHENLPRFIDNLERLEKAKELEIDFSEIKKLEDICSLNYFNQCLTQKGIDEYNSIRGGYSTSDNKKIKGVNESINLAASLLQEKSNLKNASEEEKKEIKSKIKDIRACTLEKLHKQILSDRESISFRVEDLKKDADLCCQIARNFYIKDEKFFGVKESKESKEINITESIKGVLDNISEANPEELYIKNDRAITDISKQIFGDWSIISNALKYYYYHNELLKTDGKGKEKRKEKKLSKTEVTEVEKQLKVSYYSFDDIHKALEFYMKQYDDSELDDANKDDNEQQDINKKTKNIAINKPLFEYFKSRKMVKKDDAQEKKGDLLSNINITYEEVKEVLSKYEDIKEEKLKSKKEEVEKIKNYLDSIQDLLYFLKPLYVRLSPKEEKKSEALQKDSGFYTEFDEAYEALAKITPLYNQTRNYLTKKPFNIEKYKLNFDHQMLLGGFVDSKTESSDGGTQYGAYLFRKEIEKNTYEYFLGISENSKLFRCHKKDEIACSDKSQYERLEYYQPKATTFFSNEYSKNKEKIVNSIKGQLKSQLKSQYENIEDKNIEDKEKEFEKIDKMGTPTALIQAIKNSKNYTIPDDDETVTRCNETIKEMKEHIGKHVENNPKLKDLIGQEFQGIDGLVKIIEEIQMIAKRNRRFNYFNVSEKELEEALNGNEKTLFLFQIVNKDLTYDRSVKERKRKVNKNRHENLHTMYFKSLMAGDQSVIDIGKGEMFYRKESPNLKKNNVVHKKKEKLLCKTYQDGELTKFIPSEIYLPLSKLCNKNLSCNDLQKEIKKLSPNLSDDEIELMIANLKFSEFNYDLIKDKRYTRERFSFHLSIKVNYSEDSKSPRFNDKVNECLQKNPAVNIIGIDRGERHLAYYTLINQQGEIIKQDSFNVINGKDYHNLLHDREKERDKARKSWGTIEKIKDLKEGYLSQVVHSLAKLMVENNAIIVFEDLNFGFKKGRFKVEKQVYQKLEKMLIDKLNFLVLKDKQENEIGSIKKALQLTAPFTSFKELGKQTGFIFYVPAYHTSKVCPATGFVNLLYLKYETIKKSQEFFGKFEAICYLENENLFKFHFDYEKFTEKAEGSQQKWKKWTLYSYGKRLSKFKNSKNNNHWETKEVDITKEFESLFKDYSISYEGGKNLKEQIMQRTDSRFFKQLMWLLKLTLQLRNSRTNSGEDWMISPVKDKNGKFFDSRKVDKTMPENADANGAYHIALKGLMMLKQLGKAEDTSKFKPELDNKSWYKFVQNKEYRKP